MTVKLSNSIPIPSKLVKQWKGRKVMIRSGKDVLIIKKIQTVETDVWRKLKKVGQTITQKTISNAITSARK